MIRLAKTRDLIQINRIYNQAVETRTSTADLEPVSIKDRIAWFDEHDENKYPVFVFEQDEKTVGWISVSPYRKGRRALDHVVEVSYYIEREFLRQGIGTKLMEYVLEHASEYQFSVVLCILLELNIGSIKLLEKFNFEKWGEFPDIVNLDGKICSHLIYGKKI